MATQRIPKVGDQVIVSFQFPWEEQPMTIDAVVCWDNASGQAKGLPAGCGLQFLAPTLDDRSRIEAAVRSFARNY